MALIHDYLCAHLTLLRLTVQRLIARLAQRNAPGASSFRAESGLSLWLPTLNALVSGATNLVAGHEFLLPVTRLINLQNWPA
jgi:hypothetical protein